MQNKLDIYQNPTLLYDEEFGPPCTHWAIEIAKINTKSPTNNGKEIGKAKGGNHDALIRMKYDQLCKNN